MDRIHSYKYIEEQINNSQTMTNSEKENYLKTYKTNYYAWLDELKNKLDNYISRTRLSYHSVHLL